jgi:hypothetical protein
MNPHDEITPADIQSALDALSLPSPTQLTVNLTRKHFKEGIYRIVDGKRIRKLTAELRAKNRASQRRRSS